MVKYRNIEKIYDESHPKSKKVSELYKQGIYLLRINLRPKIYLVKSDLLFLHVFPTGELFLSDNFVHFTKNEGNLLYFILHSLIHLQERHLYSNIINIYGKLLLVKQYTNLINKEKGFEHYFFNYYLYLPYSKSQESFSHEKAYDLMKSINKGFSKSEIEEIHKEMNDFTNVSISDIENSLRCDLSSGNNYAKNIIYGDFKYKNREISVQLDQRSVKKIKYKQREYPQIHPII